MNLKIFAVLIALLVLGSFADAKVGIDKMSLTLSTSLNKTGDDSLDISPGDKFYVHLAVRPDADLSSADGTLKIYADSELVYSETVTMDLVDGEYYYINVSSDDFNEGDLWTGNLLAYDCGSKTIKVSLGSKDIKTAKEDTADLNIDAETLRVTISPEKPTLTDKITVTVKNVDKDTLEGMIVKFTRLGDDDVWGTDDRNWDDTTDSDGQVSLKLSSDFGSTAFSKYQVDVYDESGDYCKYTTTLDTRVSLSLSNPDPASPMVGQAIKMRVIDQDGTAVQGAKVTITKAGGVNTYTSDSQGYVTFQINATGAFDALATKSGYTDSTAVHFAVAEKNSLKVVLAPAKDIQAGSGVTITVSGSDGAPLKGAKVSITKPDTTTEVFTSSDAGTVIYTPQNPGAYSVKAEAAQYATVILQFTAYSVFNVALSDTLIPNKDITVTVKDASGKAVSGAAVSVAEAGISDTTDASGEYTFSVSTPKAYTLAVKKDGYLDYSKKFIVQGILTLNINVTEISLGEAVEISVQDSQGDTVNAKVKISKPNGAEDTLTTDEYKPALAGTYTVSASMDGYQTASDEFTVKAYPLVLKARMDGQKIVATAISNGNPVPNISISFDGTSFHETVLTDKNGMAIVDAQKSNVSGNMTIASTEANYEKAGTQIDVKPVSGTDSSMLLVILVALIIVIIAIIAVTTKGGKKKKEKGMLYRTAGGRSSLERGY